MTVFSQSLQDESAFIQRLKGSPAEFEKASSLLFKKYKAYVHPIRKRYPSLTEEEFQSAYHDAFQAVIRMILQETYDSSKGSIGSLLSEIFSKKCIDQLRKNTNHKSEWAKQIQELVPDLPVASVEFLSELINQETFKEVIGVMDTLKPPCKQLILDVDYWGFSPQEAAKRNGYKNGHSASQAKYRCIKALRKKIQKLTHGGT